MSELNIAEQCFSYVGVCQFKVMKSINDASWKSFILLRDLWDGIIGRPSITPQGRFELKGLSQRNYWAEIRKCVQKQPEGWKPVPVLSSQEHKSCAHQFTNPLLHNNPDPWNHHTNINGQDENQRTDKYQDKLFQTLINPINSYWYR